MGRERILLEGMLVGLAGAIAVAAWFFVYDLAEGTPFRTPALLGAALFEGLRDPAALRITPDLVLKYTAVHGIVFLAFGLASAGLFSLVDRDRHVLFAVFVFQRRSSRDDPELLGIQAPDLGDQLFGDALAEGFELRVWAEVFEGQHRHADAPAVRLLCGRQCLSGALDGRDKPVAPSGQSLDESRIRRRVAQSIA